MYKKGKKTKCSKYPPPILRYRLREIVECDLEEEQAGFHVGGQTRNILQDKQMRNILEMSWERDKTRTLHCLLSAFDSVLGNTYEPLY